MTLQETVDRKDSFHGHGWSYNGGTIPSPSAPSEQELNVMQSTNVTIPVSSPSFQDEAIGVSIDPSNLPPAILPAVVVLENDTTEIEPVFAEYQRNYDCSMLSPEDQSRLWGNGEDENGHQKTATSTTMASGVAGAVVGTLLLGTIPGCLSGFYAAYATRQEGAAGDIARALGEVALVTRKKAIEIDRKHHVMERSRKAILDAWEKAKELDQEHHILQKVVDFSLLSWALALDFARRNKLLERAVDRLIGREEHYPTITTSGDKNTRTQLGTQHPRDCKRRCGSYSKVAKTY